MDRAQLSKTYSAACNRLHTAITELYEALHDYEGEAHINKEYVIDRVSEYRRWLLMEADHIREAVREFDETQGQQVEN